MNKHQYLEKINEKLSSLPRNEREDIIYDVLIQFEKGEKEGKSERMIITELGHPEDFAKQYISDYPRPTHEEKKIGNEGLQSKLMLVLVIVFNTMFVLGPAIGIAATLIAFYAIGGVLIGVPVILFIQIIYYGSSNILVPFFFVLFIVSLGTLVFNGTTRLGSWLKRLLKRYIRFNKRLIKGES